MTAHVHAKERKGQLSHSFAVPTIAALVALRVFFSLFRAVRPWFHRTFLNINANSHRTSAVIIPQMLLSWDDLIICGVLRLAELTVQSRNTFTPPL